MQQRATCLADLETEQNLAHYVRTHEKALANALEMRRQQASKHGKSHSISGPIGSIANPATPTSPTAAAAAASTSIAAAISLANFNFSSHNIKPATLMLTPHHLYYLLSRFEDLGITVGPMNVRLESLHSDTPNTNYVSFLSQSQRSKVRTSETGSIHSVSSVRSVMSGLSGLWGGLSLGGASAETKAAKQKAAIEADLKYLYSAFTKIPCLKLAPDRRARLIEGYEEFPFDTAVPLIAFKNVSTLEVCDLDIRNFFGWDRMAEQLKSLVVRRAGVDDPADLLIDIVLDDMDRRRRRSSKAQMSPGFGWSSSGSPKRSPTFNHPSLQKSSSAPGSPDMDDMGPPASFAKSGSDMGRPDLGRRGSVRPRSSSPTRPITRTGSAHGHSRSHKIRRSGSGSSQSSLSDGWNPRGSSSNLLSAGGLPPSKWRFLRSLGLPDNSLTYISAESLAPLADTLQSLDLSSNLFLQVPDSLATLTALRALNLSNCMIESLHSLIRNPLPAITALNLRGNKLRSIAGVERLPSLERLDLRDNQLSDPTELARLTGIPDLREIWISGNPFTKTHGNYRVTIFNLFRNAPGYTEDIIIDSSGPGYNERRQLVERVPEKAEVTVVKPPLPEYDVMTVKASTKPAVVYGDPTKDMPPPVPRKDRPVSYSTTSDIYSSASQRKKRAPKRRNIDLSTPDCSPAKPRPAVRFQPEEQVNTAAGDDSGYGMSPDAPSPKSKPLPPPPPFPELSLQTQPRLANINSVVESAPKLPPIITSYNTNTVNNTIQKVDRDPEPVAVVEDLGLNGMSPLSGMNGTTDWQIGGEMYRKKMEALRNETGHAWLSVLHEGEWDNAKSLVGVNGMKNGTGAPQLRDFEAKSTIRPVMETATSRHGSLQSIAVSGRTLG